MTSSSLRRSVIAMVRMMTWLVIRRRAFEIVPTAPLLGRMWQLRDNLTGYDAAYVAAAELYGCALVTADERLSHAPDLRCEVRLAF
jgi:predicted nucleic acid-binding protein